MKSLVTPGTTIEALEARIAPATFFVGSPTTFGFNDTNYDEAPFVNTETGGDAISAKVGGGAVGVADTFYLRLSAGDKVVLFTGSGFDEANPFITVKSGTVIAFFIDDPTAGPGFANEVQATELVGLSLGKGASLEVGGSVFGDVVTNLSDTGTDIDMSGLISTKQNIASLLIGASVTGNIYSGGPITNVEIRGNVDNILAGTAANGATFDFFPGVVGGEGTLAVTALVGEVGPSISKVKIDSVTSVIAAGAGGAGAKGGSLSSIQILEDTDGFSLLAGAGGTASGTKTNGGIGGDVSTVYVSGLIEDPVVSDKIHVVAGAGGDGLSTGTGGAGGKVSNVFVGFDLVGSKPIASVLALHESVEIRSGAGGSGKTGGAGGAMTNVMVNVDTPDAAAAGNEIEIIGGNGGAAVNTAGGKAGTGASISKLDLQNIDTNGFTDLLIKAGDAGTAVGAAAGAVGGSISTVTLLAAEVQVFAGNGSSGKTGGVGGSVSAFTFLQLNETVTTRLEMSAGTGGNGIAGAGANGGNVTNIKVGSGDFTLFAINAGTAANGGTGANGKGGNGGNVTIVDVLDDDLGLGNVGDFTIRSGAGASGTKGGGNGGLIDKVTLFALNLEPTITGGDGGTATESGAGGKGGMVSNTNIFADNGAINPVVSGSLIAGNGGAGTAAKTNGGAGGELKAVNLNVTENVTLRAGNGGDGGAQAAPGKGGSVTTAAGFGAGGFGILAAGNAGATGLKAAAGGSILGGGGGKLAVLRAISDLTMTAGNGSHGGAGGDIKGLSFGSTANFLSPTPTGNVLIQAGNGSAEGGGAGKGGSIDLIDGTPSSGAVTSTSTLIIAGDGGGTATSTKSGIGGSVSNVSLFGFGGAQVNPVVLTIEAGDGGIAPLAAAGGAGGSVKAVAVAGLDSNVVFRSVAAGDGAAGTKTGGAGGTVDGVNVVGSDIGVRRGQTFGYTTMGGVFAGAGGTGATKAGLAGSVRNVSADAIASIVAGKTGSPQLVDKVEKIVVGTVNGANLLKFTEGDLVPVDDGGDPNYRAYDANAFATNNLVGAVLDPSSVDGNKFKFTDANANGTFDLGEMPIDGLVMARIFDQATVNFTPEAKYVTTDKGKPLPVGQDPLFDFDNKI